MKWGPETDGGKAQLPLDGPGLAEGEGSQLRRVRSHSKQAAVVGGNLGQGPCSPEGVVSDSQRIVPRSPCVAQEAVQGQA